MDVAAVEGMSLPGIRLRNRPSQVMPNQRKVKARRKRRKELVLIQICLFGGLLLVVKGFSYFSENSGEDSAVCAEHWDAGEGETNPPCSLFVCLIAGHVSLFNVSPVVLILSILSPNTQLNCAGNVKQTVTLTLLHWENHRTCKHFPVILAYRLTLLLIFLQERKVQCRVYSMSN